MDDVEVEVIGAEPLEGAGDLPLDGLLGEVAVDARTTSSRGT